MILTYFELNELIESVLLNTLTIIRLVNIVKKCMDIKINIIYVKCLLILIIYIKSYLIYSLILMLDEA